MRVADQRRLPDWLQSYLHYTENHESQEKLHLWTALGLLSAAVRRQLFMWRVGYKLYPNIFVIIVAESGRARKSAAFDIGVPILRDAVPDILEFTGRASPEGIVKHLNRVTVTEDEGTGKRNITQDSHFFLHADELASLFGYDPTQGSRMAILLTEGYNCKDVYHHLTSGEGFKLIFNLYATLLAATDPKNMKVLPDDAVGGFLGRTIVITADSIRRPIAWAVPGSFPEELRLNLVHDLHIISEFRGEMVPTQAAKDLFEKWYIAQQEVRHDDPRVAAFHARCHDTALKLAMLIAISRRCNHTIDAEHVAGGIAFIEKVLPEYGRVISWAGETKYGQNRTLFIETIRKLGGTATKRDIARALKIPADELEMLEKTLQVEGVIDSKLLPPNKLVYRLLSD